MTPQPVVAVIGAGAAGTMAAHRLQRAGMSPTIFECGDYVGGRAKTIRRGPFLIDTGAVGLLGSYQRTREVVQEVRMQDQFLTLTPQGAIPRDGVLRYLDMAHPLRSFLGSDLYSVGAKFRLLKLAADVWRMRKILDYEQVDALVPYDVETVREYAMRELDAELYDYLAGTLTRGAWLAPAERASVIQFLWTVKNFTPHMYSLLGGMAALPTRLAAGVPVSLNSTVVDVDERPNEVAVTYRDAQGETTRRFDACIIAVPPGPLLKMYPRLRGEQRTYLENVEYSRSVNVHVGLSRRPDHPELYIMMPKCECADVTTIFLDHNKAPDRAPEGKGLVSIFLRSEWCAERYESDDGPVLAEVLAKVKPYLGDLADCVEEAVVQRWENCALMITPGIFRLMSGYKRATPDGRVHLAGDFAQFSSVNTAIVSGERAAERIIAKLQPGA